MKDLIMFSQFPFVKVLFLFGKYDEDNELKEDYSNLAEEAAKYCDIVQFDFIDSYANITMDTVNALKVTKCKIVMQITKT